MPYAFNRSLFLENGPALKAAEALGRSSSDSFRAWRALDAHSRMAMIEQALCVAANDDCRDGLPLAL